MFKCRLEMPLVRENIGAARIFCGRIVEGYMGMGRNSNIEERENIYKVFGIRAHYSNADRSKMP
jgi:hypothetical protein